MSTSHNQDFTSPKRASEDISPRAFDLLVAFCRAAQTNDAGRLWISNDQINEVVFRESGGDIRRLRRESDQLEEAGLMEYRQQNGTFIRPDGTKSHNDCRDFWYINLPGMPSLTGEQP